MNKWQVRSFSRRRGTQKAPAEKVVKDIRRRTRKQHSTEEKIRIVLKGLRGEDSIANPDVDLFVSALAHYGEPGLAHLHLYGVAEDHERRSRLMEFATAWLLERGISIEFQEGRDVYDIPPWREAHGGTIQDMGSLDVLDEI